MAKIWQISDGRSYVVNGDPGTTITYTNSPSNGTAAGKPVTSIPAGATSVTFPSNGSEVEISSDTATIDQVFNAAAAGSGSSSGGSGSSGGVSFQIVTTLPSQGAAGVIYLVKVSETGDDKFEEWIWVDSAWESIGTTAVDPTTYAKLIGGNTFEGNQVINGDLTVTGDVSGVTESNYNVVETTETTITPTGGTWVRYTGTATALTIEEPGWDGEAEISYLETAVPVDLQGVTWSPAAPVLTGDGPFVYALVHVGPGQMLAGSCGYSVVTAEAVQAVVPIAWGNYYGYAPSATGAYSISIGGYAKDNGWGRNVSIGVGASSSKPTCVTIGAAFDDTAGSYKCQTQGTGSITIGAGANTLNNGDTESSNSVTIGCKASNSGADSVVIGAQAGGKATAGVTIGAGAKSSDYSTVIGTNAKASYMGVVLGSHAKAEGYHAVALGSHAKAEGYHAVALGREASAYGSSSTALGKASTAKGTFAVALGYKATVSDYGATVIRSTAEDGTVTQLYFSGANTPLANTYEGGAPMLGYVTKDSAGNVVAAGTRSLIELLTNNSTFAPASLDENGEWVQPKVFHPSDLDLPVEEEPTEEPEDVTTNIPEPAIPESEPYTPIPVYPIVESEVPEIVEPEVPETPTE